MKRAVAIRHILYEDAGTLAKVLADRDISLDYVDAGTTDLTLLNNDEIDLLIILGGAISANNEATYPCIRQELALIKQRLLADQPMIGICLGAQLIAKALGAEVKKGHAYEFGWFPLHATTDDPLLAHFTSENATMFHWHYETFDLPDGATLLASSALYENQVFRWGQNTLGLQCHPEVQASSLENWLIGNAFEIHHAGLDVNALRQENQLNAPKLEQATATFFADWLTRVEL
jgi:GMP synthase (glutamine-hydrolysing)